MKILLLGKDGQVGWELQRSLAPLGDLLAFNRAEADLSDLEKLRGLIQKHNPSIIVNAAAYTAVDKAENDQDAARAINADAVGIMAQEAKKNGAWLIHYSTDYVFDGTKEGAYQVDDKTNPVSVYGATKLAGEQAIAIEHDKYLIFRTSWVYATRGKNFAKTMLRMASDKDKLTIVSDQFGVPTSAALIADITALCIFKIINNETTDAAGIYHLAPRGETNWHEYAAYVIELARQKGRPIKVEAANVMPILTKDYPTPAKRPRNSRLDTTKLQEKFGLILPAWQYHVERLIEELEG